MWSPFIWAAGHPSGSVLPTRQLALRNHKDSRRGEPHRFRLAYLVLLRVEIARFTRTESARLCCSDPHLRVLRIRFREPIRACRWRGVTSYAVLCSPDVPPVLPFRRSFEPAPATTWRASRERLSPAPAGRAHRPDSSDAFELFELPDQLVIRGLQHQHGGVSEREGHPHPL